MLAKILIQKITIIGKGNNRNGWNVKIKIIIILIKKKEKLIKNT